MGVFQVGIIRHPLGAGRPDTEAYQVTGRASLVIDRIQARISVDPKPDGSLPSESAIQALERVIRIKLSTDRNETKMLTVGEVPVCTFQQLSGGPLPVQPVKLNTGEECKVRVNVHPNLYTAGILAEWPGAHLEVLFYGQEA